MVTYFHGSSRPNIFVILLYYWPDWAPIPLMFGEELCVAVSCQIRESGAGDSYQSIACVCGSLASHPNTFKPTKNPLPHHANMKMSELFIEYAGWNWQKIDMVLWCTDKPYIYNITITAGGYRDMVIWNFDKKGE